MLSNNISIGKDQWIIFEDLNGGQKAAIHIDKLMLELMPMWTALETQCVAACCGIAAYSLWEEDVLKNTNKLNRQELIRQLEMLHASITRLSQYQAVLVSTVLNNYFTKQTFLKIVEHLLSIFKKI